ncbi:MAG TPA: methylmalonyl-CoA mutase family protein [Nocardioides sp.]|nr:methylmalonyl-CoA mutase family protein [Nocardioides sp.]
MTDQTVEGGLDEPEELEPDQGSLALADAGDRHSRADWEAAAAGVLRKAGRLADDDPDAEVGDRLAVRTLDRVAVTPLGTPDLLDDLATAGRPDRAGDWDIRTHLSVVSGSERAANEALLVDLANGATSLWLRGADLDLATLLEGVLLDLAPIVLDGVDPGSFLDHAGDRELHPGTNLGHGVAGSSTDALAATAARAKGAGVLGFVVDASEIHDRGASDAQELAYSLAVGATYLRALADAGVGVDEAAALVEFRYAATDEQFPTIAKLRAARRLWARVLELSGAGARRQRQHAVTSRPMMSAYDPWVNMLRTTVAAFAAGVGGADAITVLPFDSPLGVPDAFGRRIARNTSSLLIAESHVARVSDPAGGSFAVEKLTDDLARTAWEIFGRLEDGESLDEMVAATVEQRDRDVARRKRPITGLSEFPHLGEALPEREADSAAGDVRRYGAGFEALRDEPVATPVFLATMGTVASHTARAGFAANLFAAGGVPVEVAGATVGVESLIEAYDGQSVVCLAGTDAAYEEWGAEAAEALRANGASWVIVAGQPREWADDSCAVGVDALEFLARTRERLA